MFKLLSVSILTAAAAALGASAYRITLEKPAVLAGTELKPGDYKVELDGSKVTISSKKVSVDAAAHVETAADKFRSTSVCCLAESGKYDLQEIRLGGTNQKVIIETTTAAK